MCFSKTLPQDDLNTATSFFNALLVDVSTTQINESSISSITALFNKSTHYQFRQSLGRITSIINLFVQLSSQQSKEYTTISLAYYYLAITNIGLLWTMIGLLRLQLIVPTNSI